MLKLHFDWWIIISSVVLASMSLATLRGIAPDQVSSQIIFFSVSGILLILFSQIKFDTLRVFHIWLYSISIVLLSLPLIFGAINRGATRWIQIGQFSLQPSEIVKPFLLLTFVTLAFSKQKFSKLYLFLSVVLPTILVFLQPDLGTVLVIAVGWLTVVVSKTNMKTLGLSLLIAILSAIPIYKFVLHEYQRERVYTFIDPYADPLGKGYHVIQSMISVGSGKMTGKGLGHGSQSLLQFLPEHTTDFIFAALGESFGFIGTSLVLLVYLILLRRIYDISRATTNPSAAMFCIGTAAMVGFQIWVNVGMNIGIAPVTGITLPLLSRGGSSLISTAILLGIVSSVSYSGKNRFYSV